MDNRSSQRMKNSGAFLLVSKRDSGFGEWIRAARKDYEAVGFLENFF